MNRAFKTEFHNGESDEKPIVTMSLKVNNGKKFKALDADGLKNLYNSLYLFQQQVEAFGDEVIVMNKEKCK